MSQLFILDILSAATAFSVFIVQNVIVCDRKVGRTKFGYRESHISEYGTGIIVLCGDTYLIGNAIFSSMNKVLSRTNQSDYREDAKGYGKISSVAIIKLTVHAGCYTVRYISATAATAARLFGLSDLCIKYYRINDLCCCPVIGIYRST